MPEEIPALLNSGRTLVHDGLVQSDLDMNNFRLLHLDDSNLDFGSAPPTIGPIAHQWLRSWNATTRVWGISQPAFVDISGTLSGAQQQAITQLGIITVGRWHGTAIEPGWLPTLDLIRDPVDELSMANQRIINLADPVSPQDAVNRRFMDFLLQGLNVHEAVRVATTTALPPNPGLPFRVDGVDLHDNDRVLVKDQTSAPGLNGIWVAHPNPGGWLLAPDWATIDDEIRAYVNVREGDVNAGTGWVQVNPITVFGQPKKWVYFSQITGEPGPPGEDGLGVPPGGDIHQVLRKRTAADNDTEWADPLIVASSEYAVAYYPPTPGDTLSPAGTTDDVNGRMMGLAGYITPLTSGKMMCSIGGFIWNSSAAGNSLVQIVVGGGTAPINGAMRPAGTLKLGPIAMVQESVAGRAVPFSLTAVIPGATVGNQIWFDLILAPLPHGTTASVAGVAVTLFEIP